MKIPFSMVAFNMLSETKNEEALTYEEKEMTKHTLALLKKMLIVDFVLSSKSDSVNDCCYETAVQWKKEYQALRKKYGKVYMVSENKENKNIKSAEVIIQPLKEMKLYPREFINKGRGRYTVMREYER